MAFKLDDDLLQELGLAALPPQEKQAFLRHILETLEMRVGTTLAAQMTNQQLDEFEKLMPTPQDGPEVTQQKEQQALHWLESNFPNYKQVVSSELERLKGEIKQSAPQILASSQQQNAPAPQSQAPINGYAPSQYAPQQQPGAVNMQYNTSPQQPPVGYSQPLQQPAPYQMGQMPPSPEQAPQQPQFPPQQPPFPPTQ